LDDILKLQAAAHPASALFRCFIDFNGRVSEVSVRHSERVAPQAKMSALPGKSRNHSVIKYDYRNYLRAMRIR